MKTPSLEEVKAYFKNAKDVKDLTLGNIHEIDFESIHYDKVIKTDYWTNSKTFNYWISIFRDGQYAEIISYKEKTHEITETLLLELAKDSNVKEILKKEIPSLFENKLEIGKWYKSDFPLLINIQEIHHHKLVAYGFCSSGIYKETKDFCTRADKNNKVDYNTFNFRQATPQEVETALINEAKKRGFEVGLRVNRDWCVTKEYTIKEMRFCYFESQNKLTLSGREIFSNGQWATIIETPNDIITIVEKYGKDKVISLIEKM